MLLARVHPVCLRPHIQWIHVEEALPVQRDPRKDSIVQLLLQNIRVLCVRIQLQHTPCEEGHADRRAGLRVSRVIRQVIGKGKCFPDMCPSDAAGHVHVALRDVLPEALAGLFQRVILIQPRVVCHTGIQIDRAHRVSFCLGLLPNRPVCLLVAEGDPLPGFLIHPVKTAALGKCQILRLFPGKVVWLLASEVDEKPSQIQIFLTAGRFIESGQSHFRNLMSRNPRNLVRAFADVLRDAVRKAAGCFQQSVLARRLVIRNGCLREVAEAVQLMKRAQVGKTL